MMQQEDPFGLSCAEAQELISAMLDGETSPAEEAALRRHINQCAACSKYEKDLISLRKQIESVPMRVGDGAAAWVRAQAEFDRLSDAPSERRVHGWHTTQRLAAAAMILVCMLIGSWFLLSPQSNEGAIINEAVRDFKSFQASGEVLDIAAKHPDAVLTWMKARVDFNLPLQLRTPQGTQIAGARLCSLLGRRLAFFAFTIDGEDIGVYIARADGFDLPADGAIDLATKDGDITTMGWRSDGLAFVVVSRLSSSALTMFTEHLQSAVLQGA